MGQQQGLELGTTQRYSKEDEFQGKGIPWRLQKNLAPGLLVKNLIGGLTVAPHGDGFSLEESRNQI